MKIATLIAVTLPALFISATSIPIGTAKPAGGPVGEWRIADGTARVAIRQCGSYLCGFVSWAKGGGDAVGQKVLIDMKPTGHLWFGTAINVSDGEIYDAHMSLFGEHILKVEGCVNGGVICGGQQWSRVK